MKYRAYCPIHGALTGWSSDERFIRAAAWGDNFYNHSGNEVAHVESK